MNYRLNAGFHDSFDSRDTSPPSLPPWLRGFLVTAKHRTSMRLAGSEIEQILNSKDFKHKHLYATAEALLVPGCPGTVFVALRPDDCDAQGRQNVRTIAETLIQEIDREYDEFNSFELFTKTQQVPRVPHVARILPVERVAPETSLDELSKLVVAEHFPEISSCIGPTKWSQGLPSFRVRYEEHSPAVHLNSLDVEKHVADFVPEEHPVCLKNPDETILVIVAGGSVLMSVVTGYDNKQKFHHFRVKRVSMGGGQPSSLIALAA